MGSESMDRAGTSNSLMLDGNSLDFLKILRSLQTEECGKPTNETGVSNNCFQFCDHCIVQMDGVIASATSTLSSSAFCEVTSTSSDSCHPWDSNSPEVRSSNIWVKNQPSHEQKPENKCSASQSKLQLLLKHLSGIRNSQDFDNATSIFESPKNHQIEIVAAGITKPSYSETLHDHSYNASPPEKAKRNVFTNHSKNSGAANSFKSKSMIQKPQSTGYYTGHGSTSGAGEDSGLDSASGQELLISYVYQSDPSLPVAVAIDLPRVRTKPGSTQVVPEHDPSLNLGVGEGASADLNSFNGSNSCYNFDPDVKPNVDEEIEAELPFVGQEVEISQNCEDNLFDQAAHLPPLPLEHLIHKSMSVQGAKKQKQNQKPNQKASEPNTKKPKKNPTLKKGQSNLTHQPQHRSPVNVAAVVSHALPQNNTYSCPICNISVRSKYALNMHKKIHLLDSNGNTISRKCTHCGKELSSATILAKHEAKCVLLKSKQTYNCPICSKGYCSKESVRRHRKTHSGIKPHKCETCGNTYFEHYDLVKHKRKHENQNQVNGKVNTVPSDTASIGNVGVGARSSRSSSEGISAVNAPTTVASTEPPPPPTASVAVPPAKKKKTKFEFNLPDTTVTFSNPATIPIPMPKPKPQPRQRRKQVLANV